MFNRNFPFSRILQLLQPFIFLVLQQADSVADYRVRIVRLKHAL